MRHGLIALLLMTAMASATAQTADPASPSPADPDDPGIEASPLPPGSDRLRSTADDRRSLTITIPVSGPAQVMDHRDLAVLSGHNRLEIDDLPAGLIPGSLHWSLDTLPELTRLRRVTADNDEATARWQGMLFMEAGGIRELMLSYRLPGLTAEAGYQLVLAENEASAGVLQGTTTLHNQTGATLENPRVRHDRPGEVGIELGRIGQLAHGEALRMAHADIAEVEVRHTLVARGEGDRPHSRPIPAMVSHGWVLQGVPAAAADAPVAVIIGESNQRQTAAGQSRLSLTAETGEARVVAGASDAVQVMRHTEAYAPARGGDVEIGWRLVLDNPGDRVRELTLEESLAEDWVLLEGDDDWQRTASGLTRTLTLEAGEQRTVNYRIGR